MNTFPSAGRPPLHRRGGFSLVEVTLAIGIVAFAFVALFGLVPTGLNVFRSAIDASIGSQILDQVVQAAQQTDYQFLVDTPNPDDTYYDEQGNLLVDEQAAPLKPPGKDSRAIYTVRMRVTAPTPIPSVSGGGTANTTSNVATLNIFIAKNPGHNPDPFTNAPRGNVNVYTAYVARNKSAFETNN